MFLKKPGYTSYLIKGLYTVYIPPVPEDKSLIQGWGQKKEDQYWRHTPLPSWYNERREEEELIQKQEQELVDNGEMDRVRHYDERCERYRRQEWHRRLYGHWFMNKGIPVYLTGTHYTYLQWCKIDSPDNDGHPTFYMSQLDRFYFRQLCIEDPFTLGYFIAGPRGFGKSTEEVWSQLENITKGPHKRHAAIQSKTKDDAETVIFVEKMVPMFNELPHFFKPEYNHGTNPVKGFTFSRERKKGKGSKKMRYGPLFELGNTVKHYPAKEKACDGKTLADLIQDEIGKTHPREEADVKKRLGINIRSVFRNDVKRGIIRCTSTIEDMKEGGAEAKSIWDDSNPEERDSNGFTKSKIYKFLVTALETKVKFADKYGYVDEAKAYEEVMNDRAAVSDDPIELTSRMRKDPLNEEDAFTKDQSDCPFPVLIINAALNDIATQKVVGRIGNLEYPSGQLDSDVTFVDDPTGMFTIFHYPDKKQGDRQILNACRFEYSQSSTEKDKKLWIPCNDDLFTGGLDPIKWRKTVDKRASKMAAHGFWKLDSTLDDNSKPISEWLSHSLMWKYHGRHIDPTDDYENIIKALRFFGHRIMPENNLSDFTKHLYDRGYWKFVIARKDFDPKVLFAGKSKNALSMENAVDSTSEIIETYVAEIIRYMKVHGRRIKDKALLKQMLDFDPDAPTKSDLVVSFGYALMALKHRLNLDYTPIIKDVVENYMPMFDNSGTKSRLVESYDGPDDNSDDLDYDLFNEIQRALQQ